ncbi:MAG TPA: EVE domain-containing protein [Steroidobacteraceae bacterium]|nr:EVE domain-containing protein [Steroidobacteraceae bacterium]
MKYWLLKSEPDTFGIDDLETAPRSTTAWDGVRNYQARNMLRDEFRRGDLAFFYHSSCKEPGIAGIVKVVRAGYPDPSALDHNSPYFDPQSDPKSPRWYSVDVKLDRRIDPPITLKELRKRQRDALKDMLLLRRGNRLSVTPVTVDEWNTILGMR